MLLPMSFGVSSVTLLHVLDHHLKNQKARTGRPGFSLAVVFIDTSAVDRFSPDGGLLAQLKQRYPDHIYEVLPLHQVLETGTSPDDLLLELFPDFTDSSETNEPTGDEKLISMMKSLTSATARVDVMSALRTRLIVQYAKSTGCEGILWGDSTTKLAEKTLAETAKGRGFSLPWLIADGESPFGLTFTFPVRDLLKKELTSYAAITEPPLLSLVHQDPSKKTQPAPSSKSTTIDDLMKQYFESVEENFPSIVSNVVRTTSKLQPATDFASQPRCKLCQMPVADGRFGVHGWGGDQDDGGVTSAELSHGLCYGCSRSIPHTSISTT